jgi:hypothetical protein
MSSPWPGFFLAGAAKCGTTSFYAWLRQHPDIFLPALKEPNYFLRDRPDACLRILDRRVSERERYLELFSECPVIGEGSTLYLWALEAPTLIARECPNARFIVSLRDPVERAFSSYLNSRREGTENRRFVDAIRQEAETSLSARDELRTPIHLDAGFYSRGLSRFFSHFGKDRVLILIFEEFVAAPRQALRHAFSFLGVDQGFSEQVQLRTHNAYRRPRSRAAAAVLTSSRIRPAARRLLPRVVRHHLYSLLARVDEKPEMAPDARALLEDLYLPEARACEEILGRMPPWPWIST